MRIRKLATLLALLMAVPPLFAAPNEDEAAVRQVIEKIEIAMEASDSTGVATQFARTADFSAVSKGGVIQGWESYGPLVTAGIDRHKIAGDQIMLDLSDIKIVTSENMALATYGMHLTEKLAGGKIVERDGYSTMVFVKNAEGWKVLHWNANDAPSVE